MATDNSSIYIYDSFSSEAPILMGTLYVSIIRGTETFSFEFERDWLTDKGTSIILDPDVLPYTGRQYPNNKLVFGWIADASPDRWGRMLINRRERILADAESRKPKKLHESDYLLGVYDKTRMGGLRFKADREGPFLSDDENTAVPPWARLRSLEEASRHFENDENSISEKWLNQLIQPGSSLGGARPKATVADEKGQLWIAKFPSKNDDNNTGAWEKAVHDIAEKCGLNVPEARLEQFSKYGSTYLSRRFDRKGERRVHYASAMTLLGKTDGASAGNGVSYLDIASFIKANGANPKADMIELWRRIVFSMAVTNTDDHLRNHSFILTEKGWVLSPMYDINPVPYGNELALNVDDTDNRISTELVISVAERFGIPRVKAQSMCTEILQTVKDSWEKCAEQAGITRSQIETMRPAFKLTEDI